MTRTSRVSATAAEEFIAQRQGQREKAIRREHKITDLLVEREAARKTYLRAQALFAATTDDLTEVLEAHLAEDHNIGILSRAMGSLRSYHQQAHAREEGQSQLREVAALRQRLIAAGHNVSIFKTDADLVAYAEATGNLAVGQ